ncbi:MAG: hypothetical protein ACAI38_20720 [Myxococcota bacterium]
MSWRAQLGSIAERVGLDPKTVTAGADRLVNEAQKLATTAEKLASTAVEQGLPVAKQLAATAVEQGVPAAKRMAAQLQSAASAAGAVADDLVTRAKAHAKPMLSTVPVKKAVKRAPAKPAAPATPPVAAPSPDPAAETPISVRAKPSTPFDLTGLSITADDARELVRIPASLGAPKPETLGADEAKTLRDYVAATPATIFAARKRIDNNVDDLAKRLGKPPADPWHSVEEARKRLAAFDKQSGTDYAASSWSAMVRAWSRDDLPTWAHEAIGGVTQLIRHAGASPRGRSHAADVCDAALAVAHVEGWPTLLFEKDADLDSLFSVVKRAAASPDLQETVAKKLFALAGAMLASPVSPAEHAARAMNPLGLRAEVALRAADILDGLGKTSHQGLRDAALEAAGSPEARPNDADLCEIARAPRWLLSPRFAGGPDAAIAYARSDMTVAQADELVAFVGGIKGTPSERERRLQAFVRTPRIRAEIAAHFGLDARDSMLAESANVETNVKRALAMLTAYDERGQTRYSIEAAKGLLGGAHRDENARELVAAARLAFATRGTADDKRFLLEQVHDLVESSAWPSLRTQDGVASTVSLIEDVTELAKTDATLANALFIIGYKLASTSLTDTAEPGTKDDAERAIIAGAVAKAGTILGRDNDLRMFSFLERQLKGEPLDQQK